MAGNSGSSGGHFESDPREFDDAAPLAGREVGGSGAPLSGADADDNRLADVGSGESFGGEELHDETDFDEEEARALSEELGREFSDVEPEGAEYEEVPPEEWPEPKPRRNGHTPSPAHKGYVRLGGRKRRQVPDHAPEGLVSDDETMQSKVLLPTPAVRPAFTAQQRFLILDIWVRSALPAGDFAPLVGVAPHTLYSWRKRFDEFGPAGLSDQPKGAPTGSRLNVATRRAIVMLKRNHPEWGCERIQDVLMRSEGYTASAHAISRVLLEEGLASPSEEEGPPAHNQKPKSFERATPNQLWQTDLFTFILKRENRRVHMVAFMDDHSRFIVGFGIHATASGALVREVFEAASINYGSPKEVLTDNGTQYHTWRGKSDFRKLCEKRGIKQIVARPHHPQTLGKIERFWGTLWRECVESAVFQGLEDARKRIGLFIDHYNFQRPHHSAGGLAPADRFFNAAPEVLAALKARVAQNSRELAINGVPRKTVYLTGKVGDVGVSLHSEGDKVILTDTEGRREEVNLSAPGRRAEPGAAGELPPAVSVEGRPADHPGVTAAAPAAPGTSPLDKGLAQLRKVLNESGRHGAQPMKQGGEA